MRVLHLDTGRAWRGGQAQVLLLMRGLAARGHAATLLAPEGPTLARARAAGLAAEVWRARADWDLAATLSLARRLSRLRPEIVHAHDARAHAVALLAARLTRVPLVVSRRVPRGARGHPVSRLKYGWGVERYLCVSRRALEALERSGVPAARLALVRSAVEIEPAGAAEPSRALRAELGLADDAPLIGTVAALTAEKNPFVLLEAAPRVLDRFPRVHFVWAGSGPLAAEVERRRDRVGLGARFRLLGFRDDARSIVRQLTVFVLASDWEGLGTALLEAQAEGVAVVATAVGGVPEVVEDGVNGLLVPPREPRALADALVATLADPAARDRRLAAARRSVAAFSVEAMVEGTLEQYRRVLAERHG